MKIKRIIDCKTRVFGACLAAVVAWAALTAGSVGHAQTTPANLSPDLQNIVKLSQAHMGDDVIVNYIKNSGKVYNLSADDMLYLNSQGVSQPVVNALLQTKDNAPAPAPTPPPNLAPPPTQAPTPAPAPPPMAAPAPGLVDVFTADAGLNPSIWMMQTPLLQSLAQWNGSASMPTMLGFSPSGMQMSGVNGPGQFVGIQSVGLYAAPFTLTTTVSGMAAEGVPFDVYLVSPDLRQWLSVAGHLGGIGGARSGLAIRTPFGGARFPMGGGPSPEYGVWANWTGSGQPIAALGNKIFPAPTPGVPYTITVTVDPTGLASVSLQDPGGLSLGMLNAMPVGTGPFNVVLAGRKFGPTFANWQSVQLTPLGAPPVVAMTAPPETPTLDYFQAHLTPYGQWIDVPDAGAAWVPFQANDPNWHPYMDAGHWEFTDAGWYWQSDYPWGDIGFHYGRWLNNGFTGGRWAWVPAYDWAPSWVAWREGEGGMGWAPLPWGVDFRVGLGLYWHGALLVDGVGIGLGFDAYCFVGPDHFWGGDYHHYAFDHERARAFYGHSEFHAGYRMEGGHLRAEGLGRDHIAAITHHEVVVHKATEMRREEEHHNFAKRSEEHHEVVEHRPAAGGRPGEAERRPTDAEKRPGPGNEKDSAGGYGRTTEPGRTPPGGLNKTPPGRTPPGGSGKPSSEPGKKPE
ncbi:MAG TPA: DUF6600 domain-containing protein [Verrucomicrobiae bacterium]|jgi:hypothetical protein|nr:DUF6600 domain-containing protein [Verrucomicrobiae bacterium]